MIARVRYIIITNDFSNNFAIFKFKLFWSFCENQMKILTNYQVESMLKYFHKEKYIITGSLLRTNFNTATITLMSWL